MPSKIENKPVMANGNIGVSVFVKISTARDFGIEQCAAGTDKPFGISQVGPRTPPNVDQALFGTTVANASLAAISGETLMMFSLGDNAPLTAGTGGWNPGDLLMSDANGDGVVFVSGAGNYYGARALSACNAGELGDVEIIFGRF